IVLVEDGEAVAFPECHARGLMLFCSRNPRLRVERRVNLWKTVFPPKNRRLELPADFLHARAVTKSVSPWVLEASILPSLGMPNGCFSLILDGNPIAQKSSEVFAVVQRDAAWQAALEESFKRQLLSMPSWLDKRLHLAFISENFPAA
ncbi:hypothetical protein K458DRAFT_269401, partial [Lentithecium fluviatile CBS 122367]